MVDLTFFGLTTFLNLLTDLIYITYSMILVGVFFFIQYLFYLLYKAMYQGIKKGVVIVKDFLNSDKNFIAKIMNDKQDNNNLR